MSGMSELLNVHTPSTIRNFVHSIKEEGELIYVDQE